MENRFTAKDFYLFLALFVLLLVLVTTMYMIDRQWQKLTRVEAAITEQAEDIRRLRQAYAELRRSRLAVSQADDDADPSAPGSEIPPAFRRA